MSADQIQINGIKPLHRLVNNIVNLDAKQLLLVGKSPVSEMDLGNQQTNPDYHQANGKPNQTPVVVFHEMLLVTKAYKDKKDS